MLEVSRDHWFGDQVALEALVRFSDEELKHQELFRRIEAMVAAGMPPGICSATAERGRLGRPWQIDLVRARAHLHIELFTQVHYRTSIEPDSELSELWKDVFLNHWKEDRSTRSSTSSNGGARTRSSRAERDAAVDDLIALAAGVDGLLQAQAAADTHYSSGRRRRHAEKAEKIRRRGARAYRRQYIVSGVQDARFADILGESHHAGAGSAHRDGARADPRLTFDTDLEERVVMAMTCPVGFDVDRLRDQVLATYERVARDPDGEFHFHRGAAYAAQYLRYDAAELAHLPAECTARFAGVGNPLRVGPVHRGETVLDHACGAGMDALLAARRVGPEGRVIGVDMTPGMRRTANEAAERAGLGSVVDIREGFFERLPVEDASVDVVLSNGVVNLSPDKAQVFREIHRVLRPGGRLYLADVVVQRELKYAVRNDPDLWAACVAGALPEPELATIALATGFDDARITERFDCFRNTTAEAKVARDLQIQAVNFHARKPPTERSS